jgi:hypothetical protein
MDSQTMKILNRDAIMNTFQTVLALLLTTSVGFTACQSKTVDPNPATVALTPAGPATVNAGDSTVIRNVPAEVMVYVNAVNQNNLDSLALSFAPDGSVIDVSRRITGRSAIRTWAGNEVIGGTLRVLEINTAKPIVSGFWSIGHRVALPVGELGTPSLTSKGRFLRPICNTLNFFSTYFQLINRSLYENLTCIRSAGYGHPSACDG